MEEHPLVKRLPNDANWERLDSWTLRRQCSVRNIPNDETSREHMIRLLQEYQKTHVTEVRKIPWRLSPNFPTRLEQKRRLNKSTYQITQVKDMSSANGAVFRKDLTLSDEKESTCVVAFQEIPTCSCGSQPIVHCDHIMYLLGVVLNCPEPLLWQAAFLPSELEVIYRHSHAIRILLTDQKKDPQNVFCVLCFKSLVDARVKHYCVKCDRDMHRACAKVAWRVRGTEATGCSICEDTTGWNLEKYHEQNQVPAATIAGPAVTAATTTATIAPAPPTPTTNIVQQSIERKDKDNHGVGSSSSSKKKDHRDAQADDDPKISQRPSHPPHSSSSFSSSSSNVPSSCQSAVNEQELLPPSHPQNPSQASKDVLAQSMGSTSLPAVHLQRSTSAPLTSSQGPEWLKLKQQKEQERVGNPLRGVSQDSSPTLAKSLSSVPSVHYPISNASDPRARTPEQAGQTPVLSADGVDSHNSAATTAAVTAQAATPVPPDGIPGVVGCPSPVSNMDTDVHRRKAARLVRKCRRLERESARIGKRVKRGMDDIDREYKLELKILKEKRKNKYMRIEKKWERELKGLKHKREKLEKKLKALD